MIPRRPLQFSLMSLLAAVTLFCVILAIVRRDAELAGIIAMTLVGAWAAVVATFRDRYGIAYFAAGFVAGQAWYFAASMSMLGLYLGDYYSDVHIDCRTPCLGASFCWCLTSFVVAIVLRCGRHWGVHLSWLVGSVPLTYLSPILFALIATVPHHVINQGILSLDLPVLGLFAAVSVSLYAAFPASLIVIGILSGLEELASSRLRDEQEVIRVVERLQELGRQPIFIEQIMEHVHLDQETTLALLGRLRQAGELQWTEFGYRRTRRSRRTRGVARS